jgi:S-adenosylmethionine hydrolase
MPGRSGVVTLLSDFGTQDGYAGAMKGVILRELPSAQVIDVTHEVSPQDVVAGAFALAQAAPRFPPGTVHVAVVDPGVGSSRRGLIVEHGEQLYVGPDNGLLALAAPPPPGGDASYRAIDRLPADWSVHATFHGRDVFARVAARLAGGADASDFSSGARFAPQALPWPQPQASGNDLMGEVVHVDRFGNLVTNVPWSHCAAGDTVEIAGLQAVVGRTYADVEVGRLVAYGGSAGYVEVAVRDGSAAQHLSALRGVPVRVRRG